MVFVDSNQGETKALVETFLARKDILGLIGPVTSDEVFDAAAIALKEKKPIVSPTATSADIFRAFGGKDYIWRTLESDVAQVKTLLVLAGQKGTSKISLVSAANSYGATFFDWFGFLATELGFDIGSLVRYEPGTLSDDACVSLIERAMEKTPDTLMLVPATPEDLPCMIRAARAKNPRIRLLASDAARFDYLTQTMGNEADGLEGVSLSSDPSSGFTIAYEVKFGQTPSPVAATTYDAMLLFAYGLEKSGGQGGETLALAMKAVVDGRGEAFGWDEQGVMQTLEALKRGRAPDIGGAASSLSFDADFHTELTQSYYAHWRIEYGAFVDVDYFSTGESNRAQSNQSAFRTLASLAHLKELTEAESIRPLPEKEGLWALIVATSFGWENYRHQADALAQYHLLRNNGLDDENIILILADDIAAHTENPAKGVIQNDTDGDNLYDSVEIDYRLNELTCDDYFSILLGQESEQTPIVLESAARDNLYLFIVGHGNDEGVAWMLPESPDGEENHCFLRPEAFNDALKRKAEAKGYRQALVIIEACHSGVMGLPFDAPYALMMTGANPYENSLAANFDLSIRAWLADDFAFRYKTAIAANEAIAVASLYEQLYFDVSGSHVSIYNSRSIPDVKAVSISEFITR